MKILVFIAHYLPGRKSGGPVKTLYNMTSYLNYDFYIVTLNYDIDGIEYDLESHIWHRNQTANIYYINRKDISLDFFRKIVAEVNPNFIYLNSFFDRYFSIPFTWMNNFFKLFPKDKIILAPRGEFSPGALNIKSKKKTFYIKIANLLAIYSNIIMQASNCEEKKFILSHVKCKEVRVASDIPDKIPLKITSNVNNKNLKIIHLGRISPMKNLIFCLEVLKECQTQVIFDIYGPIEDQIYFNKCLDLISCMPSNVHITYKGIALSEDLPDIFSGYDLFFLPSLGENFCHAIAESLTCGVPVLISDRTPWVNLENAQLGWDLSLDYKDSFVQVIDNFKNIPLAKLTKLDIYKNFCNYFHLDSIVNDNLRIFS